VKKWKILIIIKKLRSVDKLVYFKKNKSEVRSVDKGVESILW
jgi:hypothetical protein